MIAAARIGTVKLASVDTTNAGLAFGILARQSALHLPIKSVTSPALTYDRAGSDDQFAADFHVKRLV